MWKKFKKFISWKGYKDFNDWLNNWKPIHLCWLFIKFDKPIPKYFIGTATAPSVTTNDATSIQAQQATGNGDVTSTGGSTTSWEQGFVWSVKATNSNPLRGGSGVSEIVTSTSGGTGAYSGTLATLTASTLYNYKAFAVNNKGTAYGAIKEFTTSAPSAPTVSTGTAGTITTESFIISSNNVTSTGGATVTERGVVYMVGTSGDPTTSDSKSSETGTFGTGTYNRTVSGLSSGTSYRVRAFAINSAGTGYGSTITVVTNNAPPTVELNSPSPGATGVSTTPTLEFTGTDPEGNDIEYEIEIDTTNTFNSLGTDGSQTYHTDASVSGPTDSTGFWTDDGNAFDGSIETHSYSGSSTNTDTKRLIGTGTSYVSGTPGRITQVRARIYGYTTSATGSIGISGYIYYSTTALGTARQTQNSLQWGDYETLSYSRWSWTIIKNLKIEFSNLINSSVAYIYICEIETTYEKYPIINKYSDTDDGFANITTPADTHPFNSTDKVGYTVQAGDTLTASTTYYWRVRGKDPSGSNTYGAWATTRSFTTGGGGEPPATVTRANAIMTTNTLMWGY